MKGWPSGRNVNLFLLDLSSKSRRQDQDPGKKSETYDACLASKRIWIISSLATVHDRTGTELPIAALIFIVGKPSRIQEPQAISLRQYLHEIHQHGAYAGSPFLCNHA